jgi:hypothetical protein
VLTARRVRVLGRRLASLVVAGALNLYGGASYADTYICKTPDGRTLMAERLPPECADRETRRMRPNGTIEIIEPKPTPEQIKQREDEAKRQRDEAERARDQMRQDYRILEAYKSEQEIESARNRELARLQVRIEAIRNSLRQLRGKQKKLEAEAEFFIKRQMPENLRSERDHNDAMIQSQEKALTDTEAEMLRVNERYDLTVKRFRELTKPRFPAPPK